MLDFARQAVPENGSFYIQKFPFLGSQGFAVVSEGEVYALFESGIPMLEDQPITDIARIEALLSAYYYNEGYNDSLSFSAIHAGLISVRADHEKGEEACRRITGTDVLPCNSYDACRMVCLGTPFCQNFAASGKPGEFIRVLLEFENNSKQLDAAYLAESVAYSSLTGGITPHGAEAYLESLSSLNRAATRASGSPLYTDYSYCFEPDYALPVITNMQLSAQKAYAQSSPFLLLNSTAQLVRMRTLAALERKATMPPLGANNTTSWGNASSELENITSSPPAPSPAAPMDSIFLPAAAALALTVLFIAGAYFLATNKKGKKGARMP
jgi:hypothetical protein